MPKLQLLIAVAAYLIDSAWASKKWDGPSKVSVDGLDPTEIISQVPLHMVAQAAYRLASQQGFSCQVLSAPSVRIFLRLRLRPSDAGSTIAATFWAPKVSIPPPQKALRFFLAMEKCLA